MPNLPNLSTNRSFSIASPSSFTYQNGSESYRDKIREKIQNTPRSKNGDYTARSIDLSITSEKTYRSSSRFKNYNQTLDFENDVEIKSARESVKSARNRHIYYNNNNDLNNQPCLNSNEVNLVNDKNNSDIDFDINENNYLNRRKRFENNNFAQNNNNKINENNEKFKDRIQTAKETTRAPMIIPRKLNRNDIQSEISSNSNLKSSSINTIKDQDIFPGISTNFQEENKMNRNRNSLSIDSNKLKSDERPYVPSRMSFINNENNSSMIQNQRDTDTPPVPLPRKRDMSTKLLTNESNDFRIKRISSSKLPIPPKTYLPSPRVMQPLNQDENRIQENSSDLEKRRFDLTQKYIKYQTEKSPRIKSNYENLDFDNNRNNKNDDDIFGSSKVTTGRRGSMRIEINLKQDVLETRFDQKLKNKSRHSFD